MSIYKISCWAVSSNVDVENHDDEFTNVYIISCINQFYRTYDLIEDID